MPHRPRFSLPAAWLEVWLLDGHQKREAIRKAGSGTKDRAWRKFERVEKWESEQSFVERATSAVRAMTGHEFCPYLFPKIPRERGDKTEDRAVFFCGAAMVTVGIRMEIRR